MRVVLWSVGVQFPVSWHIITASKPEKKESGKVSEAKGGVEGKRSDEGAPNCPNKSNPFHHCSEYCYKQWSGSQQVRCVLDVVGRRAE